MRADKQRDVCDKSSCCVSGKSTKYHYYLAAAGWLEAAVAAAVAPFEEAAPGSMGCHVARSTGVVCHCVPQLSTSTAESGPLNW